MTQIDAEWLRSKPSQAVCAMLEGAGHQALFVGGCIRNELLNAPVRDLDISTDAPPGEVLRLAKSHGFKAIPTGIDHGTITVVVDHVPFEITTFRKDVETNGRHAVVAYADNYFEDAHRRDFTMNALYAGSDGIVLDPLNGLPDLQERRFRFIDDPFERIKEDFLRILRFFRFYAWYGDPNSGIDADGLAACAELAEGLETLSQERVTSEVLKLLGAPNPSPALGSMSFAGILSRILPGADIAGIGPYIHFESELGLIIDPIARLVALGDFDRSKDLRLSRVQLAQMSKLSSEIGDTTRPSELGYRHGRESALQILALRSAMIGSDLDPNIAQFVETGVDRKCPVRAVDLLDHVSGPALGAKLAQIERRWIDSDFTLTKHELLD